MRQRAVLRHAGWQDAKRRQAETMEEFEFDGKSISIESEAVRVAVLNVQEAAAALDKVDAYDETMEAYDQVLCACTAVAAEVVVGSCSSPTTT